MVMSPDRKGDDYFDEIHGSRGRRSRLAVVRTDSMNWAPTSTPGISPSGVCFSSTRLQPGHAEINKIPPRQIGGIEGAVQNIGGRHVAVGKRGGKVGIGAATPVAGQQAAQQCAPHSKPARVMILSDPAPAATRSASSVIDGTRWPSATTNSGTRRRIPSRSASPTSTPRPRSAAVNSGQTAQQSRIRGQEAQRVAAGRANQGEARFGVASPSIVTDAFPQHGRHLAKRVGENHFARRQQASWRAAGGTGQDLRQPVR